MALTITSANSIVTLMVPGLFDVPQILVGYSADAMFATEDTELAVVRMGADGNMAAGWKPYTTQQTFTMEANSVSRQMFEDWMAAQLLTREVYFASGLIVLPAIARSYQMSRGVLTRGRQLPDGTDTLQPVPFVVTWEAVKPANA